MATTRKMAAVSTVVDAEVVAPGAVTGVAAAEVVNTEVIEDLSPVIVHGSIQFMLPSPDESVRILQTSITNIQNTLTLHTGHLEAISHRVMNDIESIESLDILYEIREKLNKRIHRQAVEVSFMKVNDMAQNLSVSKSFLEKNMGEIFLEGTHYTRAIDARLVRWNVEQMHKWVKGELDETDNQLLSKLLD